MGRRRLTGWGTAALVAVFALATPIGAEGTAAPGTEPIRVFVAKSIVTMDDTLPRGTAVAVRGGRILSVGDLASLEPWLGGPHTIDRRFEESVLLPGLIDNHLHPLLAALLLPMVFITPEDWELPEGRVAGVDGRDAYLARLRAAEAALPPGAWLDTWGHHALFHGPITRADLDAVSTERPIVVWQRSFHETVLNSRALEATGLDAADFADHPHVDWANGHFFETGNAVAVRAMNQRLFTPERLTRGLDALRALVHRGGITTMADMGVGMMTGSIERDLAMMAALTGPETPFRTVLVAGPGLMSEYATGGAAAAREAIEALPPTGSEKLRHLRGHVKLLADGAFFSQLMQMGPPGYIDGHHGEWLTEPAELEATAREFWNAGYRIHVHANGDAGVGATLEILAKLQDERPRFAHGFTFHHFGFATSEQVRRLATLGAGVSANPNYVHVLAERYARSGLGPERASQMVRLGSLVRAGAPVSLHSDLTMAPARPLFLAQVAATRRSIGGAVHAPTERLTPHQALRAVTLDAAAALGLEEEIGSVRAGKRADFTVVDRDPFEVGVEAWSDVVVEATVFEGVPAPVR